jgi:hypothetical protein
VSSFDQTQGQQQQQQGERHWEKSFAETSGKARARVSVSRRTRLI